MIGDYYYDWVILSVWIKVMNLWTGQSWEPISTKQYRGMTEGLNPSNGSFEITRPCHGEDLWSRVQSSATPQTWAIVAFWMLAQGAVPTSWKSCSWSLASPIVNFVLELCVLAQTLSLMCSRCSACNAREIGTHFQSGGVSAFDLQAAWRFESRD